MRRGSAFLGLLIALVGLAMIGSAFYLAYELFRVPPSVLLKIVPGEVMDFGQTVQLLMQVAIRVVMLVLMAAFGSMFANRGIKLYEADRKSRPPKDEKPAPSSSPKD